MDTPENERLEDELIDFLHDELTDLMTRASRRLSKEGITHVLLSIVVDRSKAHGLTLPFFLTSLIDSWGNGEKPMVVGTEEARAFLDTFNDRLPAVTEDNLQMHRIFWADLISVCAHKLWSLTHGSSIKGR